MKRPLDVCDWNICMVSLTLNIIRNVLNQISGMVDQLKVFFLQIKVFQLRDTLCCRLGLDLFWGNLNGLQFKDIPTHFR